MSKLSSVSPSSSRVKIELTPKPGFCIKTSTLGGALPPSLLPSHVQSAAKLTSSPTSIPEGLKVFVNIAWDPKVPASPKGSEGAILRALEGEDVDVEDATGLYIPAIVSSAREDTDKAGNPSLVFDCIYNTTTKAHMLRNPDFKTFLIELSIQRIESQASLILSREIRTPNIASKGKLAPRTAEVPASLFLETPLAHTSTSAHPSSSKSDVRTTVVKTAPTGIQAPRAEINLQEQSTNGKIGHTSDSNDAHLLALPPLDWSWTKDNQGRLRIEIQLPGLTSSLISTATLDMEPRKMVLAIPNYRPLHINLELSDTEISSRITLVSEPTSDETIERRREEETMRLLRLKRERDFDVEAAEAEWKIGSGMVVIYV